MKKRWRQFKNRIRTKMKAVLPQRAWQIISWRPKNKWLALLYKFTRLSVYAFLFFLFADLCFPLKTKIEYAPVVRAKDEVPLYTFLTRDEQWRFYTELEEISPDLSKAIIYKEDRYFYYHPGVNLLAIGRAVVNNILQRKRTSGASTISMQVARLLEPKQRSYSNKLVEIFRALQLELHYSKKEILQLYLNLVPYGSNIQGVKAASLLYFNKSPDQLSLAELTALSIIPNRPNSLVMGKDNALIVTARNKWLRRFGASGLFPPEVIEDALEEPLKASRNAAPRLAPQFALRMKTRQPGTLEINTSIDANIQYKAEVLTANYTKALKLQNIHNAAVIVIDNKSREVLAYIGSPDFSDFSHQGQVDGVKAIRSPGSTLKPLLYGLAFDLGIATPKTVIADIPVNYKGYAPENYDLDYRGNVSIEEALRQSLNIPSVKVLNSMGVQNFVGKLYDAGFQSVWKDRNKMGLSMILGGCGVRLEELAALYASFANEGQYAPLRWTKKDAGTQPDSLIRILSPEAAYMVTNVLHELQRPDLPAGSVTGINIPQIAWKTGTSYGRRDAWSIGYNQHYTIGVWIGNFNGQGANELNGAGTATPLLFQLFNTIDKNRDNKPVSAPAELQYRLVCAQTGSVPNTFCTQLVLDSYIPGVSPNTPCMHLKEQYLSADGKFAYCTSCLPANGYITKTYPNIEPELASFYHSRNISFEVIPEHNPDCSRSFDGIAPRINTLNDGATYLITDKGKQELQLSCAAANDAKMVYWYINDQFIGGVQKNEKLLFIPADRNIKISCTDDKGRASSIFIKVKFI